VIFADCQNTHLIAERVGNVVGSGQWAWQAWVHLPVS